MENLTVDLVKNKIIQNIEDNFINPIFSDEAVSKIENFSKSILDDFNESVRIFSENYEYIDEFFNEIKNYFYEHLNFFDENREMNVELEEILNLVLIDDSDLESIENTEK